MTFAPIRGALRRTRWTAVACLALLLASCTGTFEVGPPTLLVVGFDDGAPQMGLVEDTFRSLEATDRDLLFVAGSERPLPEPAVAIDVVDRAGTRPTAVVLARATQPVPATYLRGFSLQGIDPAAPAAFAEDPAYAITLANGGVTDPGVLDEFLDADYCLVDAQTSRTGRYLTVFEDRSVCGTAENFLAMYVIDLAAIDGPSPVTPFDQGQVGTAGMFVDQEGSLDAAGREAVYFVQPARGLRRYLFDRGDVEDLEPEGATFSPSAIVDIGRVGDSLVLVERDAYVIVTRAPDGLTATRVESSEGLDRIVSDPLGISTSAVLLAGDALVVHETATADAFGRESFAPSRTDASLEPIDLFVYLLGDARIGVFDLLTFEGNAVQVRAFSVPGIPSASVVTWTRAAADAIP